MVRGIRFPIRSANPTTARIPATAGGYKLLMDLCQADLRCLDAHSHLGNFVFDCRPKDAIHHYEAGFRIGELSLGEGFDNVLPMGFRRQSANKSWVEWWALRDDFRTLTVSGDTAFAFLVEEITGFLQPVTAS